MVLNVSVFVFDLFGHSITTHLGILKSMLAHSHYLSSLFSWTCIDWRLFVMAARSFVYATKLIVRLDVPKVYPFFPLCNHFNNGSRNIKKMYGLSVSFVKYLFVLV